MGWWSVTILGGDLPLDILDKIESLTGLEGLYPFAEMTQSTKNQLKLKLDQNLESWTEKILSENANKNHNVILQVLALITLAAGSEIPTSLKTRFLNAAKNDEWSNFSKDDADKSKRKFVMNQLIEALESHDGKSVLLLEETLIDSTSNQENMAQFNLENENTIKKHKTNQSESAQHLPNVYGNLNGLISNIPKHLQDSLTRLQESEEELRLILHKTPTSDQLAQYAGMDIETVNYLKDLALNKDLGK
jgi:hypothetical protein